MSSGFPIEPNTLAGLALILHTMGPEIRPAVAGILNVARDYLGGWVDARRIRLIADAEAEARITKAEADVQIQQIKSEGKLSVLDRAAEREQLRLNRQQRNVESVVTKAITEAEQAEKSDQKSADSDERRERSVDPDWTAQFFEACQNIGDSEMQRLWGKLLAGEVSRPGTFSKRTLEAVRVMSKQDAELFTRFCSLSWYQDSTLEPVIPKPRRAAELQFGITFEDILHLESIGLIKYGPNGFTLTGGVGAKYVWVYFNKPHILSHPTLDMLSTGMALFTDIGRQLAWISGAEPNESYRMSIVKHFRDQGWSVRDDIQIPDGEEQESE